MQNLNTVFPDVSSNIKILPNTSLVLVKNLKIGDLVCFSTINDLAKIKSLEKSQDVWCYPPIEGEDERTLITYEDYKKASVMYRNNVKLLVKNKRTRKFK
jgi:hypothetical protein